MFGNVIQPAFLKNGFGFGDNGVDSVCALWLGLEIMVLGFVELHRFCDSTPWRCQCANCVRDLEFAELRCWNSEMERRFRGGLSYVIAEISRLCVGRLSFDGEIAATFLDFAHSQAENQTVESCLGILIRFEISAMILHS
jgi:hypothetical protein